MTTRERRRPGGIRAAAPELLVRVQHHPSRAELLDRLLPGLAGLTVEVVTDPKPDGKPSAWRTYRECLSRPHDADWLLIVQDDVIPADNLHVQIPEALQEHPGRVVCLFLAGHPIPTARSARRAHDVGERHVEILPNNMTPTVATAWPADIAAQLVEWGDENVDPEHRDDDSHIGRFMRHRPPAIVRVPCLFQHPDDNPSLVRRRHMSGRNRLRTAAVWTGRADYG